MSKPRDDHFGQEHAKDYDDRFAKLQPWRDALQFTTSVLLSKLPEDAHVLIVGAGTGLELEHLAERFPNWRFTAVEPAPAMFAQLSARCERLGLSQRCTLHQGYLATLPGTDEFDAATMLLVSQFVLDSDLRRDLFAETARRLKAGGRLVNAELSAELDSPRGQALLDLWIEGMTWAGIAPEALKSMREVYGRDVAVVSTDRIEAMIEQAGFEAPIPILQTLLIHAWLSVKPTV